MKTIRERLDDILARATQISVRTPSPDPQVDIERLVDLRNEVEEAIDQIERALEREA